MTKQTTIVVIGSLRVKKDWYLDKILGLCFLFHHKTNVVGTRRGASYGNQQHMLFMEKLRIEIIPELSPKHPS